MLSLLAAATLLAPPHIDQPPRLRTILPNGSVCLVEPHFEARSIQIDLVASTRGARDAPETHGWRHLLEHLLVKGRDGKLDARLEIQGGFLRAETYRDATAIQIEVPPDKLDLGMSTVEELLREPVLSDASIARECQILNAELALKSDERNLADAGWKALLGVAGLDPEGDLDSMRKATAADLSELYLRQFRSSNLALVISGPVDLNGATKLGTALLARVPGSPPKARTQSSANVLSAPNGPRLVISGADGGAVCVSVEAYNDQATVAVLAAALGFAANREHAFLLYTPASHSSVLTLGEIPGGTLVQDLTHETAPEGYFTSGKILAKAWLQRQMVTPRQTALLRGLLLSQDANASPERIAEAIDRLTLAQFRQGFERLQKGLVVEGG